MRGRCRPLNRGLIVVLALASLAAGARADDGPLLREIQQHVRGAHRWFSLVDTLQFDRDAGGGLVPRFSTLTSSLVLPSDSAGQRLTIRAPATTAEPMEVGIEGHPNFHVLAMEQDVAEVAGTVTQGIVVYRNAVAGGDLLYKLTPTHADEYLYLRAPPRQLIRRVDLETGSDVGTIREAEGVVLFLDRAGIARLRANAPFARGADGSRREGTIRLEGRTLVLSLDLEGLPAPVLVDPDWSTTGTMSIGRFLDLSWLLPGGDRVLVAGGCAATTCPSGLAEPACGQTLATTETWDGRAGTWAPSATMATGRFAYAGVAPPGGDLLVAGGCATASCSTVTAVAERYSPSMDRWTAAGSLSIGRAYASAVSLTSGAVLVIGGCDASECFPTVDRYDPGTGGWSPAAALAGPRGHAAVLALADGQVLVTGGCADSACSLVLGDAEIFDPTANRWSSAGAMSTPRAAHTATELEDGRVLVAGGCADATCGAPLSAAELWSADAALGGVFHLAPSMLSPRHGHQAVRLLTGEVLVIGGGEDAMTTTSKAEVFVPASARWVPIGAMAMDRAEAAAALLPSGDVLVAGGCNPTTCLPWSELYSPASLAREEPDAGPSDATTDSASPVDAPAVRGADFTPHPAAYRTGVATCASDGAQDLPCPQPGYAIEDGDLQPDDRTYLAAGDALEDRATGLSWDRIGDGVAYSQAGALRHCQELGSGWRAPSVVELDTLVDYGRVGPSIAPDFAAANTEAVAYWTTTGVAGQPLLGWTVDFNEGMVVSDVATATHPVRCVRSSGPDAGLAPHLRQSGPLRPTGDTVLAPADGLEWQRRDDGTKRSWRDALGYCAALRLDQKSGWHLPNVLELHGLVDYGDQGHGAALDPSFEVAKPDVYWSSTTNEGSVGFAWIVNFNSGVVDGVSDQGEAYTRCVRHVGPAPGCGCSLGGSRVDPPAGGALLMLALLLVPSRRRRTTNPRSEGAP